MSSAEAKSKEEQLLENKPASVLEAKTEQAARQKLAEAVLLPERNAARITEAYNPRSGLDINIVAEELKKDAAAASSGDLTHVEAMLMNQAQALDAIFSHMAVRAKRNGDYPDIVNTFLGPGLRAQNQCRTTLQALAELKLPKSQTFVRQANIAEQQLVNNGELHAGSQDSAKELMDEPESRQERLDTRTAGEAVSGHPSLAAVETVHRAAHSKR